MIDGIGNNNVTQNILGNTRISNMKDQLRQMKDVMNEIDTIDINKPMSENIVRRTRGLFNPEEIYSGSINANVTQINVTSNGFMSKQAVGNIGNKKIDITYSDSAFNNSCKGEYNGNTFELKLSKGDLLGGIRYITGTMNGEAFEIDLRNSKVPEDKDTQDILTTVLLLNGLAAKTYGDNFAGVKIADWKQQQIDEEMYIASTMQ